MISPQQHLADLGYRVFPCAGKTPLTKNGCKDATTDEAKIAEWSERWPNANWAIATDGLCVVDVDPLADGANTWPDNYEKSLDLAVAPISLTPRNGKHYLFRAPPNTPIGNTVGKLAPNVDTRGAGGYIVAPPSMNDGRPYRWLTGELDLRPDELPLPPDWLLESLTGAARKPSEPTAIAGQILSGNRNMALTRMAGYLRRAGHDAGEIFSLLSAVNQKRCQPPMEDDELRNIAKSVGRYPPDAQTMAKLEQSAEDEGEWQPMLVNLADVEPEPIRWLWPGRIALGKLTLIAGEPGQGKSTMLADLTARVTTGRAWPDAQANEAGSVVLASPGSVVLLSAEDDIADTIRPRLDAAGANVSKVTALQGIQFGDSAKERCFNLESDLPLLEQAIQSSPDCRLIVIDPVSSYTGKTDSHKNAETRGLLAPLARLASRYSVAVVLVTHFSKGQNRKAMHAPTGSIAYIAASRAAWAVVADKNDPERRLFLSIKNNLAKDSGGLAFRIVDRDVRGQTVGAVEWDADPVTVTADEALDDGTDSGPSAVDDAAEWLAEFLASGPKPRAEVEEAAAAELIKEGTLRRAKKRLHIQSRKEGYQGEWVWFMPGQAIWGEGAQRCADTPIPF